jgi:hypothetical protein
MQMSPRAITGIVSFCVALTGLFLSNMFLFMMIGEINRKRQEGNLVSYFGFALPKMLRIFGEYRRQYPGGKMHIYSLAAFAFAIIGLIGVGAALGFLGEIWGQGRNRVMSINHVSTGISPPLVEVQISTSPFLQS